MPLEARLGLPAGEFSYVLEDWQQRLCVLHLRAPYLNADWPTK